MRHCFTLTNTSDYIQSLLIFENIINISVAQSYGSMAMVESKTLPYRHVAQSYRSMVENPNISAEIGHGRDPKTRH
jgi:hypothetical protein